MTQQGEKVLNIQSLLRVYGQAGIYQAAIEEVLYAHYKNAFKISQSIHFRGDAADAFKGYIKNGAINVLTGLMDVVAEMTMTCQLLAEGFYVFEHNEQGVIVESVMDTIAGELTAREECLNNIKSEIRDVNNLSSQYIAVKSVDVDAVNTQYGITNKTLTKIRTDMYALDEEAGKYVNDLCTRITALKDLLHRTMGLCYKDGVINPDELRQLRLQSWYYPETNLTLYIKLQEDPFVYSAGEVTLAEDQWAVGLCSDVYAYAGYSFVNASYEEGVEDGAAFRKAKFSVLEANGYAQLTDYLAGQANLKTGYVETDVKAGFSEDYVGFKVDAGVGLVKLDGSIVLGNENINAFIKGDVKVFCADGKAAFEFKDNGEFAVGVDASATLASVGIKGGMSLFSYTNRSKDTLTGQKKEESLLGFNVGAKLDAGGSFAAYAERKNVIGTEFFNIQTTRVKLDIALGIGIDVDVTVPSVSWSWNWFR